MADRYWVGGTGTWDSSATTNWATASGGSSGASAPTSADNVFFDVNSNVGTGAFTVTRTTGVSADFTASGLDGAMTLSTSGTWNIYGSISLPASNFSITSASGGTIFLLASSGLKTITTNGVTLTNQAMRFAAVGATYTLQDNLVTTGTSDTYFYGGTLNLNTKSFTAFTFYFSGGSGGTDGVRTLAGGAGSIINITGLTSGIGGTIAAVANLTVTGTIDINLTGNSTSLQNRLWINSSAMTAAQLQNVSFNITAGADTVTLANEFCDNFNTTGFSGTLAASTRTIYGNFTIGANTTCTSGTNTQTFASTSGTKTITTNGVNVGCPLTFDGVGGTWTLQDNLTTGITRTVTFTNGTLNLNDKTLTTGLFSSSNSNTRTIAFGVGNITITGVSGTVWQTTTVGALAPSGLILTGTPTVNITNNSETGTTRTISPGSGALEVKTFSFNITAGSDTITITSGHALQNLNFTGFSGILSNTTRTIYGSLTLSSTMTCTSGALITTFAASSGTKTITTNGVTTDFPITFNTAGGWQLVGNLTMTTATRTLTFSAGTLNANGYNVTIGLFDSNVSNVRALQMGGGIWTILGSGATAWNLATTTNMTLTNSNSIIDLTSTTAKTFAGGGLSYGTLRNSGSGALTITGANTFVNLRSVANTVFPGSATTTITDGLSLNGRYGSLTYLRSSAGSATISKASGKVYATFCNIANTTATGGATFRAPATPLTSYGNVDGGTNSGWTFTAMGATDNPNPGAFSSFFN